MRALLSKVILIANNKRKSVSYLIGLFLAYGLVKSIVYFAPLLLNRELNNIQLFGEFEYALNLGQTFSAIFALGLPNAYAYFVFKEKLNNLEPLFHNVFIWLTTLLLVFLLISPSSISNLYYNAAIMGVALANQLFISTYYKLKGKNILAIIMDCGVYILLLVYLAAMFFHIAIYNFAVWSAFILLYIFAINIKYHICYFGGLKRVVKSDWIKVFNYGTLIVFSLFLTSLLTTSTRIYIEYFNGFVDVGVYSLFIRIASAIIIFHRVIVIMLYRKIYSDTHYKLDKYFGVLISIVLFAGLLLFILVPTFIGHFITSFTLNYASSKYLFLWSIYQAISWALLAVLELIIYRENLLKKYIIFLMGTLLLMGGVMIVFNYFGELTTLSLLKINVLAIITMSLCQFYIIKKGVFFYKYTFFSFAVLTVIAIISLFLK